MTAPSSGPLSYRFDAPMRWVSVEAAFDQTALDHRSEANLRVLTQLAQFDERAVPTEQPTPQDMEIARLHNKLDLLLSAIGELAPKFLNRPPHTTLQLSWQHVRWAAATEVAPQGSLGLIELYLHPIVLQPLRWPARMGAFEAGWAEAELLPASEAAQQALERHVFQQHRRAIAALRR